MDILFTLNELGILRWVEDASVVLFFYALWECVKWKWDCWRDRTCQEISRFEDKLGL